MAEGLFKGREGGEIRDVSTRSLAAITGGEERVTQLF